MWSPQRSMDNTDKCVQIYELSTNTTSRMIYVFAKDRVIAQGYLVESFLGYFVFPQLG